MLGKAFQRRIFNVLLDRTTFLTLIGLTALLLISAFQFGEAWLEWSADKYAEVFNSFSDNLLGRSLQGRLCQHVPIDVVYTWVNGSDPVFLDDLKHAKERLKLTEKGRKKLDSCPYEFCVPSNLLIFDRTIKTQLDLLKEQNHFLFEAKRIYRPHLACGTHVENRSVLEFDNPDGATQAVDGSLWKKRVNLGISQSFNVTQAYWTSDWTAPNSFPMKEYLMLTALPPFSPRDKLVESLPGGLRAAITDVFMYDDLRMAVVETNNASLANDFVEKNPKFVISDEAKIDVRRANLLIQLPQYHGEESYQSNRFADYEQLRYSLRSLEKYAPWVRRVYLVTNGQIPHWLNMDHPKLTLVTHEEIFDDRRSLPTFSSPAIESNLHKIAGLSEKFLYFNDDIMLGTEVWPEDFYTRQEGFKVYMNWPVPDCSPNCPSSWVKDGYCDAACNTTQCQFDGGDCIGPDVKMGFSDVDGGRDRESFLWNDDSELCAPGCLNTWIADKYCDESCNVAECAYDAGDCGIDDFDNLKACCELGDIEAEHRFVMSAGQTVAFWNLTKSYEEHRFEEFMVSPAENKHVRSLALSETHKVLTAVLFKNVSRIAFNVSLQGRADDYKNIFAIRFDVEADTTGHEPMKEKPKKINWDEVQLPREIEEAVSSSNFSAIDETLLNLTKDESLFLALLKHQLENEELTLKGFNARKNKLLVIPMKRFLNEGGNASDIINDAHRGRKLLFSDYDEYSLMDGGGDEAKVTQDNKSSNDSPPPQALDSYGESLLFVHNLYSAKYGHAQRDVPAHMPHFVDISVMRDLQRTFLEEWRETSKHAFREGADMQFSFSYFHFLLNEKKDFAIGEIFDEFDTDSSSTWSDREIRTLLARMHNLPLYLEIVQNFEEEIINCSKHFKGEEKVLAAPPAYERYFDSKLPLVSKGLIINCPPIVSQLEEKFRQKRRYKYQVLKDSPSAVFKTLTSNVSDVVRALDDLRKNPRKFVCINDNTDPNRADDNKYIQALLVDFFESILPVPSSFELPAEYRNKYLHLDELSTWQFYRKVLKWAAYLCIIGLIVTSVAGFFNVDLDKVVGRFCSRIWGLKRIFTTSSSKRRYNV